MVTSLAVMFSTWIIVWIMIGHNTKPMVLAFLPWTILFLGQLIERWSLLRAALLILAVHFLFESAHPQTAFYGNARELERMRSALEPAHRRFVATAAVTTKGKPRRSPYSRYHSPGLYNYALHEVENPGRRSEPRA